MKIILLMRITVNITGINFSLGDVKDTFMLLFTHKHALPHTRMINK